MSTFRDRSAALAACVQRGSPKPAWDARTQALVEQAIKRSVVSGDQTELLMDSILGQRRSVVVLINFGGLRAPSTAAGNGPCAGGITGVEALLEGALMANVIDGIWEPTTPVGGAAQR